MKLKFEEELGKLLEELTDQKKISAEKSNQLQLAYQSKQELVAEVKAIKDQQFRLEKELEIAQSEKLQFKKQLESSKPNSQSLSQKVLNAFTTNMADKNQNRSTNDINSAEGKSEKVDMGQEKNQEKISDLRRENSALEAQAERLKRDIDSLKIEHEVKLASFEQRERDSGLKETELTKKLSSLREAEQLRIKEVENLKKIVEEYKSTIKSIQDTSLGSSDKDKKIGQGLAEIQQLKSQVRDAEDENSKLRSQVSEANARTQRLEENLKQFEEQASLQSLKQSNIEAKRFSEVIQINMLKKKQEELLQNLANANKNYEQSIEKQAELMRQIENQKNAFSDLERQKNDRETQLQS